MFLHKAKEFSSSGPFPELVLEESTPGSAALQILPRMWLCQDLFQGFLLRDCTSMLKILGLFPAQLQVCSGRFDFHQAWRRASSMGKS